MHDTARSLAVVGIGSMGRGLAYQAGITPGVRCDALADIDLDRPIQWAAFLNRPCRVVRSAAEADAAIGAGSIAITDNAAVLADCRAIDVLIESSSDVAAGGVHAERFIAARKHVVMMNAEADLLFGPYLLRHAQEHGVVYTSTDGDQHGVIKRLVDDLRLWGLELVMAGNIKGFLDRAANPTTIVPEAVKRNYDPKQTAGYTDGSKLNVEMALLANALGLSTRTPGMSGPRLEHVTQVLEHFDFDAIRGDGPVVDYILGAEPNGGVFAVGYCDSAYQRSMLATLKMGDGPYYVVYRPYHLCHIEAMMTVMQAARGVPLLQPVHGFRTNVYAYAKRDLRAGEHLDGVGGYCCYGLIENCDSSSPEGVPICLSDDMALVRDVRQGERLAWNDVRADYRRPAWAMFEKARAASATMAGQH